MLSVRWMATAAVSAVLAAAPMPASAGGGDDGTCRVLAFDFTPADELQIVMWIENASGEFLETIYITQLIGTYGLGNRPGIMEFNSAYGWPYGRRDTVFPVWAHRHGEEWPLVEFQNLDETNLSHPFGESSHEQFYCRPLRPGEAAWDTQTCASIIYTDKGRLSASDTSLYPPRADLDFSPTRDDPSVGMFNALNPFDAVSRATPPGGQPYRLSYAIPEVMGDGDYVAWIEVSSEFDQNTFYDFPSPTGIPWSDYGLAYRGQPSVVYRVPFSLGHDAAETSADGYAGYGDPDGLDGAVREPDNTITEGVDGSGASRLLLTVDGGDSFRFRVATQPTEDDEKPGAPDQFEAIDILPTEVAAQFMAPGNDGEEGVVSGYEIRYRVGDPITEENFADSPPADAAVLPEPAGTMQELVFSDLEPNTNYYFGVRAYDQCLNISPVSTLHVLTPRRATGEVDACFIATAAFGSAMQADVTALRSFRDLALRSHTAGELFVTGYYTFGPALARVIAPSDTLRRFARAALRPAIAAARDALSRLPGR